MLPSLVREPSLCLRLLHQGSLQVLEDLYEVFHEASDQDATKGALLLIVFPGLSYFEQELEGTLGTWLYEDHPLRILAQDFDGGLRLDD